MIKKLSIDRAEWLCATNAKAEKRPDAADPEGSSLLADDGMKCCLGFLAAACGISDRAIQDKCDFSDLSPAVARKIPKAFRFNDDPALHNRAVAINDQTGLRPDVREKRLKKIFAEGGVRLTFRGKYL